MALAEGGIVSGALLIGLVVTTARALASRRHWLLTGILGAFAVYSVAAFFNGMLGFLQLTVVVFTVVGAGVGLSVAATMPGPIVALSRGRHGAR
jgi:Na+/melibiose symporter-like transporter